MARLSKLEVLVTSAVEALGHKLWGCVLKTDGDRRLCVFIDDEAGPVTMEALEALTRQISGVLDVEDPIAKSYRLEVSSPGMNRTLFQKGHYHRVLGKRLRVRLRQPLEGRKQFVGVLEAVTEKDVTLTLEEGETVQLAFDRIDSANVAPQFEGGKVV